MATETKIRNRPAAKRTSVLRALRHEIVTGRHAPGCRLPTRLVLQKHFGVSMETMQRVVERLTNDGFIESRGGAGTFVSDTPPHLHNFGLVFPYLFGRGRPQKPFWSAMQQAAVSLQEPGKRKISFYYGPEKSHHREDLHDLLSDLSREKLAGLILASNSHALFGTPVMEQPGIPRVVIEYPSSNPNRPAIYPDIRSFFVRSFEHLKRKGRRYIAIVTSGSEQEILSGLPDIASAQGLRLLASHIQACASDRPWFVGNLVELLLSRGNSNPVDGLIIADDSLVEPVMAALMRMGVRVPDDLEIVIHCNFPCPPPAPLPVCRLGFDVAALISRCLELLGMQREGIIPPGQTLLPAVFEHELYQCGE